MHEETDTAVQSSTVKTWNQPTYPSVKGTQNQKWPTHLSTGFTFKRGWTGSRVKIQTDHKVEPLPPPKKASCRTIHTMILCMKTEKTQNKTVSWSWRYVKINAQRDGKAPREPPCEGPWGRGRQWGHIHCGSIFFYLMKDWKQVTKVFTTVISWWWIYGFVMVTLGSCLYWGSSKNEKAQPPFAKVDCESSERHGTCQEGERPFHEGQGRGAM